MKSKKYTLIELLISMGIFAVMMLLLLNFFSKYQDFTYMASARNDALSTANTLFAQLEKDLRSSVTYTRLKPNGGDDMTTSLPIKVGSNDITFASHCQLSGTSTTTRTTSDTGSGGLAYLKYSKTGSNTVTRGFMDIVGNTFNLSTATPTFASTLSPDDIVAEGVTNLTFTAFKDRASFLSGSGTTGDFYFDPASGKNPIYAILCTVSIKDPNPAANAQKTVRDLQKIILLTP